ncbi:MAG: hypothetical protein IJY61_06960 [Candidatus Gastranaerophilales bacterium]|nr:hypothetical protein [Candidatus Gastranaerophilales bacterium]
MKNHNKILLICLLCLLILTACSENTININSLSEKQLDYYCIGVGYMSTRLTSGEIDAGHVYSNAVDKVMIKHGLVFNEKELIKYQLKGSEDLVKSLKNNNANEIISTCTNVMNRLNYYIKYNY